MTERKQIVAVALLTERELASLGASFDRAWPVEETPCFNGLLEAIDRADKQFHERRDRSAGPA